MKTLIGVPSERQPWQPTHWITMSGYALTPSDLRVGTTKCSESRDMTVAVMETNEIIRKVMKP